MSTSQKSSQSPNSGRFEDGESVDHPKHYTFGGIEVIDVIEGWKLPFHLANVIKYVSRAPYKSNFKEDLQKARWYLDRFVSKCEDSKTFKVNVSPDVPDIAEVLEAWKIEDVALSTIIENVYFSRYDRAIELLSEVIDEILG